MVLVRCHDLRCALFDALHASSYLSACRMPLDGATCMQTEDHGLNISCCGCVEHAVGAILILSLINSKGLLSVLDADGPVLLLCS